MKIQLQPNQVNNITTLASVQDGGASIEYLFGGTEGQLIYISVSDSAPQSLNSGDAQAVMVCDLSHSKSVRCVEQGAGQNIYAWFNSINTQAVNVLVG